MVGRLVQEQQIGIGGQRAAQRGAAALAAAGGGGPGGEVGAELIGDGLDGIVPGRAVLGPMDGKVAQASRTGRSPGSCSR